MREELLREIDTLEGLYYLVHALNREGHRHIRDLRDLVTHLPRRSIPNLRKDVRKDIARIRKETRCLLSSQELRLAVKNMTTGADGYACIPKWYIEDHWFGNYSRAFPRWPHMPLHTLVVFDTNIATESRSATLVPEGMLFEDAGLLWCDASKITADGMDFRSRPAAKQRELQTYLRATATAAYRCVEAYLNGIAFNCFQTFHNEMELVDHDLLAEWNSKERRARFVPFERKINEYPTICGKYLMRDVDLTDDENAKFLTGDGKFLRDSLTHPSPYINPKTRKYEKIQANIAINFDQVKRLLRAVAAYVWKVEVALGRDPKRSAPWLKLDL